MTDDLMQSRWFLLETAGVSDKALLWETARRRAMAGRGGSTRLGSARVARIYHNEFKVAKRLIEKGWRAFVPVERLRKAVGHRAARRSYVVEQPMLPGYLFVRAAVDGSGAITARAWSDLLAVRGVYGFVCGANDGAPMPLREDMMAALIELFDPSDERYEVMVFDNTGLGESPEGRRVRLRKPRHIPVERLNPQQKRAKELGLSLGSRVRIVNGAFEGFLAVLKSVDRHDLVTILADILGASVPVQLKAEDVEQELAAEPCA